MRGYRALLAAGGPEQPLLLERILALAAARPAWFFDGLELARQALGRWPQFPAAHAALASITLAQGDAREAAGHLTQLAQLASADGDDDQAALAALAGARLLRVLEPEAATQLYELALEHDPSSSEAADSLADRLADEQRWPELVRLVRARAVITADPARAVQLRLRLADVFVHQLGDPASAQHELAVARELAPDDPAVHEMAATILSTINPPGRDRGVARGRAARRGARRSPDAARGRGRSSATCSTGAGRPRPRGRRALDARPAADRCARRARDAPPPRAAITASAADLYERLRGLGLPQHTAARYELELARSLVAIGRIDDARASLRRATLAGGETAAEAHAVLAEIAEATDDRDHAAAELDTAIACARRSRGGTTAGGERLFTRAAELAVVRARRCSTARPARPRRAPTGSARTTSRRPTPRSSRATPRARCSRARATTPAPSGAGSTPCSRRGRRPPSAPGCSSAAPRSAAASTRPMSRRRSPICTRRCTCARSSRRTRTAPIPRRRTSVGARTSSRPSCSRRAAIAAPARRRSPRSRSWPSAPRDRVEVETAAAAAWLAADEPAAALPHGARAHAELRPEVPAALRREVLATLGEAAWRQRAWPDVIRAYRGLIEDPGAETPRVATFRYRLAVAADRSGDADARARRRCGPLVADPDEAARATAPELRGQALRLYADLAERAGDLAGAAAALEGFASLALEQLGDRARRRDVSRGRAVPPRRPRRRRDPLPRGRAADLRHPPAGARRARDRVARARRHRARVRDPRPQGRRDRAPARPPEAAAVAARRSAGSARAPRRRARDAPARARDRSDLAPVAALRDAAPRRPPASSSPRPAGSRSSRASCRATPASISRSCAASGSSPRARSPSSCSASTSRSSRRCATSPGPRSSAPRPRAPTCCPRSRACAARPGDGRARSRYRASPTPARRTPRAAGRPRRTATRCRSAMPRPGRASPASSTTRSRRSRPRTTSTPATSACCTSSSSSRSALGDHEAAARHLTALAELSTGPRRGNTLLELAEIFYDQLDDPGRGPGRDARRRRCVRTWRPTRRDAAHARERSAREPRVERRGRGARRDRRRSPGRRGRDRSRDRPGPRRSRGRRGRAGRARDGRAPPRRRRRAARHPRRRRSPARTSSRAPSSARPRRPGRRRPRRCARRPRGCGPASRSRASRPCAGPAATRAGPPRPRPGSAGSS